MSVPGWSLGVIVFRYERTSPGGPRTSGHGTALGRCYPEIRDEQDRVVVVPVRAINVLLVASSAFRAVASSAFRAAPSAFRAVAASASEPGLLGLPSRASSAFRAASSAFRAASSAFRAVASSAFRAVASSAFRAVASSAFRAGLLLGLVGRLLRLLPGAPLGFRAVGFAAGAGGGLVFHGIDRR